MLSKLDEPNLRRIANAGGGNYYRLGANGEGLRRLRAEALAPLAEKMARNDLRNYHEAYYAPLMVALHRRLVTGAPATSYELDVTDPNFKFPQTWRTNIGLDRRLPGGLVGTVEYIYNRDLNDPFYINANLPGAQSQFVGVDNRLNWVGPACAAAGQRATSAPIESLAPTWRAATPATAASADVPSHRSGSIAGDLAFEGLVRPAA